MTAELLLVLGLLAAAIAMFAAGRPRSDVVGLLVVLALPLSGVISVPEALAGFADPNVVLIALLFVLGEALVQTGVAQRLGDWLVARAGANEATLMAMLMATVALVGSMMSSTAVVALFIPVVLRIARNAGLAARRLLMPVSVAALVSGMMTLVATAPNLVVQSALERGGHAGFGFFAFTPFGMPMLALAIGWMLLARSRLDRGSVAGPPRGRRPDFADWIAEYGLVGREHRLRVEQGSPLVGQALEALDLRGSEGASILAIERAERFGRRLLTPSGSTRLEAGDVLLVDLRDDGTGVATLQQRHRLQPLALNGRLFADIAQDIGMAEVMVPAHSSLPGKTAVDVRLRSTLGLNLIGIKRGRTALAGNPAKQPLELGDTLLLVGPWRSIRRLSESTADLVVIRLPAEFDDALPASHLAGRAVAILLLVVALMASGAVPNVLAALAGCLLMVGFRCIDMASAYRAIHWPTLVLIVGMLPFAIALERTGGIGMVANWLGAFVGDASPRVGIAALFVTTAALGLFLSNTATAVLMAPVAIGVAETLGVSPYPYAMTVALAASAAFMTPVSSPVNMLVVGPGGYSFGDFVRVGVPLAALAGGMCIVLLPLLLPF